MVPTTHRRADAQRNIAAILAAALDRFATDPGVSMADVARTAGVGRVTLYAHFPSREALLGAVLDHVIELAVAALDAEDGDGPADEALRRVIGSSWQIIDRCGRLRGAVRRELGETTLRRRHDPVLGRVDRLLARGQDQGVFRTDLPRAWLAAVFYSLIHAANDEVEAGRLPPAEAAEVLERTLRTMLCPPPGY